MEGIWSLRAFATKLEGPPLTDLQGVPGGWAGYRLRGLRSRCDVRRQHQSLLYRTPQVLLLMSHADEELKDLMQIGDGATGIITRPLKQGGLVAIYYLGTLLGALLYDMTFALRTSLQPLTRHRGGAVSDKIGRRKSIVLGCLWGLFGSSLQVAAQNASWMLCARVIAGVGTGIISAVIPVWGSELVSHNARGKVMAFEMVVNFAGISTACKVCPKRCILASSKFIKIGSNIS